MLAVFFACRGYCYCLANNSPSWFKISGAEITNQPYARTIVVSAEGKVSARPDVAETHFAVVSEMPTVKQVTLTIIKMNEVIKSIKALGVEGKDINFAT